MNMLIYMDTNHVIINTMSNWIEIIKTKELQPDEVDTVIYHHPCSDGTGSGFCAWKYLSNKFPNRDVKYYPMSIGAAPPPGLENKNVLICDYSYRKDILLDLLKKVNKFLVIDHHKSAEKDLQEIDNKYKIFHMGYSGAMLTWYYFFPEIKPPLMIEYIQDRDIWTKKLPNTDDFASWFYTLEFEFEEYNKYLDDDLLLNLINIKGKSFGELNDYYTKQSIDYAVPKFCKIKDKYYFVAYVNSSICKSDIGNQVFNKHPFIDFSAVYSINDVNNSTNFSLRSTDKHSDVSEIAFSLNGGGHRNASGVTINDVTNHLSGIVYDNGQLYKLLDMVYFQQIKCETNNLTIAYLNTPINKHEFGSYLLQKKYTDKNNDDIHVAENLYMLLNKIEKRHIVNMAITYSYNPHLNISEYVVLFSDSVHIDVRKKLIDGCDFTASETYKCVTITHTGNDLFLFTA